MKPSLTRVRVLAAPNLVCAAVPGRPTVDGERQAVAGVSALASMGVPPWQRAWAVAAALFLVTFGTPNAASQDIRTYNPPSQQRSGSTSQQPQLSPREDVYDRFRTDVGRLSESDRTRVRSDLQTRINAARTSEEVAHYERLLGILQNVR